LKQSLGIKENVIIDLQKEIKRFKLQIAESKKAEEKLNIELEIAKKERNENILQIHEMLKKERQQYPSVSNYLFSTYSKKAFPLSTRYQQTSILLMRKILLKK
jgi:hypothetical protein